MMPTRPPRPLFAAIQDHAIRIGLGAAVAACVWVWTKLADLEQAVAAQETRLATMRDTHDARYMALRERTDASADDLKRRIDRVETQNAQIAVHVLEVVRAVSRIEARLSPLRTPPLSRESYDPPTPN